MGCCMIACALVHIKQKQEQTFRKFKPCHAAHNRKHKQSNRQRNAYEGGREGRKERSKERGERGRKMEDGSKRVGRGNGYRRKRGGNWEVQYRKRRNKKRRGEKRLW